MPPRPSSVVGPTGRTIALKSCTALLWRACTASSRPCAAPGTFSPPCVPNVPSPEDSMQKEVDLYDGYYGYLAADPQVAVRRETYDEDLGQASWITLTEAREFFRALELGPGHTAL